MTAYRIPKEVTALKRSDGKLFDNPDPIYSAFSYVLKKRYDAMNMVTVYIPMEPMRAYINSARQTNPGLSYLALILSAYVRAAARYPGLKRFVVNRRMYCRNKFTVSMVVMRPGEYGTMDKVDFEMTDTVYDVNRRMGEFIERNRNVNDTNKTDRLVRFLVNHPLLIGFLINTFIFLDNHNILPKSLIAASPFHTSLLISNLGSIRLPAIYHHVYEFGTTSIAITMGVPEKRVVMEGGAPVERAYLPLGIVMDERIAPGSYFGQVLQYIQHLLRHPEELEVPPAVVNEDPVRE